MVLTRRGRLLRTILVALAVIALLSVLVLAVRGLGGDSDPTGSAPTTGEEGSAAGPAASDGGGAAPSDGGSADPSAAPTPEVEADPADEESVEPGPGLRTTASGIIRSDTVGDGTWMVAPPVPAPAPAGTVHRYALRIEGGIGIVPEEAAAEVARILADERGWRAIHDVSFEQVADPAQAEFTISLASPPTVDQLCLPARTHGIWSCRIGSEVALNSDRWIHMTPTYGEIGEYRAYMVNHEVGHYLGHGHATCPAEGVSAPVMLQQSMGLDGCRANPWPTLDGQP